VKDRLANRVQLTTGLRHLHREIERGSAPTRTVLLAATFSARLEPANSS
jgi:hypothetical protein